MGAVEPPIAEFPPIIGTPIAGPPPKDDGNAPPKPPPFPPGAIDGTPIPIAEAPIPGIDGTPTPEPNPMPGTLISEPIACIEPRSPSVPCPDRSPRRKESSPQ